MSIGAIVPANGRGCGNREQGGVYVECGVSSYGRPVEDFLVDPPARATQFAKMYKLLSKGVKLVNINGVYHIFDIVGEKYYPNVSDMVEEIRRYGMSRRCELPSADEYAKITSQSEYVLLHRKAWTDEFSEYAKDWIELPNGYNPCPRKEHKFDSELCAGFWWQDVEPQKEDNGESVVFTRHMPSFEYVAAQSSKKHNHELGIFAKFPITRFVVVRGGEMKKKLERTKKIGVPLEVVDE